MNAARGGTVKMCIRQLGDIKRDNAAADKQLRVAALQNLITAEPGLQTNHPGAGATVMANCVSGAVNVVTFDRHQHHIGFAQHTLLVGKMNVVRQLLVTEIVADVNTASGMNAPAHSCRWRI